MREEMRVTALFYSAVSGISTTCMLLLIGAQEDIAIFGCIIVATIVYWENLTNMRLREIKEILEEEKK